MEEQRQQLSAEQIKAIIAATGKVSVENLPLDPFNQAKNEIIRLEKLAQDPQRAAEKKVNLGAAQKLRTQFKLDNWDWAPEEKRRMEKAAKLKVEEAAKLAAEKEAEEKKKAEEAEAARKQVEAEIERKKAEAAAEKKRAEEELRLENEKRQTAEAEKKKAERKESDAKLMPPPLPPRRVNSGQSDAPPPSVSNAAAVPPLDRKKLTSSNGASTTLAVSAAPAVASVQPIAPTGKPLLIPRTIPKAAASMSAAALRLSTTSSDSAVDLDKNLRIGHSRSASPYSRAGSDSAVDRQGEESGETTIRFTRSPTHSPDDASPPESPRPQSRSQKNATPPATPSKNTGGSALQTPKKAARRITSTYSQIKELPKAKLVRHADELGNDLDPSPFKTDTISVGEIDSMTGINKNRALFSNTGNELTDSQPLLPPTDASGNSSINVSTQGTNVNGVPPSVSDSAVEPGTSAPIEPVESDEQRQLQAQRTDKRVELDSAHSRSVPVVYKGSAFNENMRSWDKAEQNFHAKMSEFLIPPKITISTSKLDELVASLSISEAEKAEKKRDYLKFINCEADRQATLILQIMNMPSPQKEEYIKLLPEKSDLLAKYMSMSEHQQAELKDLVDLNDRVHQKALIDRLVALSNEEREQYIEFLQLSNWDLISLYLTEEQRREFATLIGFYHELVQTPSLFHNCDQYSEIKKSSAEIDEEIDIKRINHLYDLICDSHHIEVFITTVALIAGFTKNERLEEVKNSITARLNAIHKRTNDNDALKFLKKSLGYHVKFSPLLLKRINTNPASYLGNALIQPIQILAKRDLCLKEALKKAPANKMLLVHGKPLLAKNGRKISLRKRISDISHRFGIYGQKVNRVERIHNFDHDAAKLKTVILNYIKRKPVSRYLTQNHLFAIAKVMSFINCYRKTGVGDKIMDRLILDGITDKGKINIIRKKIELEKAEYNIHLERLQKLVERWYISHRVSMQIDDSSFEKILTEINSIIKTTRPESVLRRSLELLLPDLEALNPSRLSVSGASPKSPEMRKSVAAPSILSTSAFHTEAYQPSNMFIWEEPNEQEGGLNNDERLKNQCQHFIRISILEHVLQQFLDYDFSAAKRVFKSPLDSTQNINYKIIMKLSELIKSSPETLDKICENISIRDLIINVISNEISKAGVIPAFVLKGPFQKTINSVYIILNEMVLETEQARTADELFVPNPLAQTTSTDSPNETWVALLANALALRNYYTRALPLGDKVAQAGFAKPHKHKHWMDLVERVGNCAEEVFLEERTDEYDFLVMSIPDEYDFLVMTISEHEKIDINLLQGISYNNDDRPILIKQGGKYFICGYSKGQEWKLTELNANVIRDSVQDLDFPLAGAPAKTIVKNTNYRKIYTEITAKEGHASDDLALNVGEAINLDQMQDVSRNNGNKPILIKYLNAYYIYGYSNANADNKPSRQWKLTELDPAEISKILEIVEFPEDGSCGVVDKNDGYAENSDGTIEKLEAFSDFYVHVASKVGHTSPEKAAKNEAGLKKLIAVMEQAYFEIDDSFFYGNEESLYGSEGSAFKDEIADWINKHKSYRVPPADGSDMREVVTGKKRFENFDKMFDQLIPADKARNIIYKHFIQKASHILLKYLIKVDDRKLEQTMLMKVSIVNDILKDLDAISKYEPQELQKIILQQKVDDPYKNIHGLIRDIISSRILNNPIFREGDAADMLAELGEYCSLLPVPITKETQAISLECPIKHWRRPLSDYGIAPVVAPAETNTVAELRKRLVMQYDNPIMNPNHWYTDTNIDQILHRLLIDGVDAHICPAINPILQGEQQGESSGSTSLDALRGNEENQMELLAQAISKTLKDKIPSVMVLDLTEEIELNKAGLPKYAVGNHWISLVIKPNLDSNNPNTVTMTIIDSEGNEFQDDAQGQPQNIQLRSLDFDVTQIIQNFEIYGNDDGLRKWHRIGKLCDKLKSYKLADTRSLLDATAEITVTGRIQQSKSDGWNCGPYAVDNIVAEVKPNFIRTTATRARQLHAQHFADYATQGKLKPVAAIPEVSAAQVTPGTDVASAVADASLLAAATAPHAEPPLTTATHSSTQPAAAVADALPDAAQQNPDSLLAGQLVAPNSTLAIATSGSDMLAAAPATPRSVTAIALPNTPAKQLRSSAEEGLEDVLLNDKTEQNNPNPFSYFVAQVLAITDCSFKTELGIESEQKEIMLNMNKSLLHIFQEKLGVILNETDRQSIIAEVMSDVKNKAVDMDHMAFKLKRNLQNKLKSFLSEDLNKTIDDVVRSVASTARKTNYNISHLNSKPEYNKHADDLVRFAVEKYIQLQEYKGELREQAQKIIDQKKRQEIIKEHEQLLLKKQNGLLEALKNKIIVTETKMNKWSIFKLFFNGPTPYTLTLKDLHESISNVQTGKITFEQELERESETHNVVVPRLQQLAQYNHRLFAASATESDNYVERHVLEQVKTRSVKFERGLTGFFSSFFKLIMQRKASVATCDELTRLSAKVTYENRAVEINNLSKVLGKPATVRELALDALAKPISCGGMLVRCFTKGFFAIGLKSACNYLEHLLPEEKRKRHLDQILIPSQIDRYTRNSKKYPLEEGKYNQKLALLNGMARIADLVRGNGLGVQLADKAGIAPLKLDSGAAALANKLAETAASLYLDKRTDELVMIDARKTIEKVIAELRKTQSKKCQFLAELEALCDVFFNTVYEPKHENRLDPRRVIINPEIDHKNAADYLEMNILQAASAGIAGYSNVVNSRFFKSTYDPKITEAQKTSNNINDLFRLSLEQRQAALWRYQGKVDLAELMEKYLAEREKETPDAKDLQRLKEKLDRRQKEMAIKEAEKIQRQAEKIQREAELQEKEKKLLEMQRALEKAQAEPGAMQVKDRAEIILSPERASVVADNSVTTPLLGVPGSTTPRMERIDRKSAEINDGPAKLRDATKKSSARKSTGNDKQKDFREFTMSIMSLNSAYPDRFWTPGSKTITQEGCLGEALGTTSSYFDRIAPKEPKSIAESVYGFFAIKGDARGHNLGAKNCSGELRMEEVPEEPRVLRRDIPV